MRPLPRFPVLVAVACALAAAAGLVHLGSGMVRMGKAIQIR